MSLEITIKTLYPNFSVREINYISKKLTKEDCSENDILGFDTELWFYIYVDAIKNLNRIDKKHGKKN